MGFVERIIEFQNLKLSEIFAFAHRISLVWIKNEVWIRI